MLKRLRIHSKITLVSLSLLFCLGVSKCDKKVDAYECILITVDNNKVKLPVEKFFWYCVNKKTGEEREINIADSDKCIRDLGSDCKWVGTDLIEREKIRSHYEAECQN